MHTMKLHLLLALMSVFIPTSLFAESNPKSAEDLLVAFKQALAAHDTALLNQLQCWDHVPKHARDLSAQYRFWFSCHLNTIDLAPQDKQRFPNDLVIDGDHCHPNLAIFNVLVVNFEPPHTKSQDVHLPLGQKDGRIYIVNYVPVKR
jgi:hypothetical protein